MTNAEERIPKDEKLMQAILAGFRGILTENGYNSNLGSNIFEERSETIPAKQLPALNFTGITTSSIVTIGLHEHHMVIGGELFLGSKITDLQKLEPPQIYRLLKADIISCVGKNLTWDGIAEDTSVIGEDDFKAVHYEGKLIGAKFNFAVDYTTAPFNPYE